MTSLKTEKIKKKGENMKTITEKTKKEGETMKTITTKTLILGLVVTAISIGFVPMLHAGGATKVTICHLPPGNPDNPQTITVSEKAVASHLANHSGDALGACCSSAAACDDGDACTDDGCGTVCTHVPVDCNDGNVCTVDSCDSLTGCSNDPAPAGLACDDGDLCTDDACDGFGACKGTEIDCDDSNACTGDDCNSETGLCESAPISCNDFNLCTVDDCDTATGCFHTDIPDCCLSDGECNDGNLCTDDSCCTDPDLCGPDLNKCVNAPNSADCDDRNLCTTDQCSDSACVGTPIVCPDTNNDCTEGICNEDTGQCDETDLLGGTSCSDGDPCTDPDLCQDGACEGQAIEIDDGVDCTDDSCVNGTVINTTNDSNCAGNDEIACTLESCDPTSGDPITGCMSTPTDECDCSDTEPCPDDGNVCTDIACVDFACDTTNNTASCDDNDACTDPDVCADGSCSSGPDISSSCDDTNACTDDSCEADLGCQNEPISCNDNNVCTNDSCIAASGCQNSNNTEPCDDGNSCTISDGCDGGACAGSALDCEDDGDICTADICIEGSGCVHEAIGELPDVIEICTDGIDNDCDGFVDGDDSECVVASLCPCWSSVEDLAALFGEQYCESTVCERFSSTAGKDRCFYPGGTGADAVVTIFQCSFSSSLTGVSFFKSYVGDPVAGAQECLSILSEYDGVTEIPATVRDCPLAPPCVPIDEICDDQIDNDCDALIDNLDIDCSATCVPDPAGENCSDGADNDCDGYVDDDDPDCATAVCPCWDSAETISVLMAGSDCTDSRCERYNANAGKDTCWNSNGTTTTLRVTSTGCSFISPFVSIFRTFSQPSLESVACLEVLSEYDGVTSSPASVRYCPLAPH